jgi:hypothetical protein
MSVAVAVAVAHVMQGIFRRWATVLEGETNILTKKLPEQWKDRAIESFDEQFVKEVLLQGQLLAQVGSNYIGMAAWAASFKEFNALSTQFEDPYFATCLTLSCVDSLLRLP